MILALSTGWTVVLSAVGAVTLVWLFLVWASLKTLFIKALPLNHKPSFLIRVVGNVTNWADGHRCDKCGYTMHHLDKEFHKRCPGCGHDQWTKVLVRWVINHWETRDLPQKSGD